jgi:hypothetical protein
MHSNGIVGFTDADNAALAAIVADVEKSQEAIATAQAAQMRALARAGDLARKQSAQSLAHLCQRHHSMKQFTAWRVRQLADGVLEWTSPLGRTYTEYPPSLGVHFRPSVDDPDDADPPEDADIPDTAEDDAPF